MSIIVDPRALWFYTAAITGGIAFILLLVSVSVPPTLASNFDLELYEKVIDTPPFYASGHSGTDDFFDCM